MLRFVLPAALAAFCTSLAWLTYAGVEASETAIVVSQHNREFSREAVTIPQGEKIRFTNEDEFLHQVYVDTAEFAFDSNEQSPGEDIEVAFTTAGEFEVRCGIHPRMSLKVTVQN